MEDDRDIPLSHIHHDDRQLELSGQPFVDLVTGVAKELADHLDSLAEQPAWNEDGGKDLARSVMESLPWEGGEDVIELVRRVVHEFTQVSYNAASPGYMAFIAGGGLPLAAVADLIAATINRFVTVWVAAPALAQIETTVVRWFAEMVGFGAGAGGYLTSGGSLANWSAVVTARHCKLGDDFQSGCIYVSDQGHHCIQKAAALAGFPAANVRLIPSDDDDRMSLDLLRDQIQADIQAGSQPFLIVGNGGTTNTGAVDNLQRLADISEEFGIWFHVDAAYGGFFALTDRGRQQLDGLDRSDSVTLDPHKALFLPFGSGCLLVKRWEDLKRTHYIDGAYMPDMQGDPDFVDISTISPELSRDFRGLRVWLPLKVYGAQAFADQLDEKLDLTVWAHQQLTQLEHIEVLRSPQLTIIAFRYLRDGAEAEELNRLNREFFDVVNRSRRFFLTPTTLKGKFVMRICIVSFRTHLPEVEFCLSEIRRAVEEMEAGS